MPKCDDVIDEQPQNFLISESFATVGSSPSSEGQHRGFQVGQKVQRFQHKQFVDQSSSCPGNTLKPFSGFLPSYHITLSPAGFPSEGHYHYPL